MTLNKYLIAAVLAIVCFNLTFSYPSPKGSYGYNKELIPDAYNFYWNVTGDNITIELHVKNVGWFGFGFSPNGGMFGSDVVVLYPSSDVNKPIVRDSHIVAASADGIVPDQQQDWHLLGHENIDGFYRSRFTRSLRTCDPNNKDDIDINTGKMKVIYAYGYLSQGSLTYHGTSRGVTEIQLIGSQKDVQFRPGDMIQEDSFDMDV
jgi:hypothetical protein